MKLLWPGEMGVSGWTLRMYLSPSEQREMKYLRFSAKNARGKGKGRGRDGKNRSEPRPITQRGDARVNDIKKDFICVKISI
jgi:hypothetical protein